MRLESWDYSSNGVYFVTFCTHRRKYLFGNVKQALTVLDSPEMILNDKGRACRKCIDMVGHLNRGVAVDTSIIMPNHVHLLIRLEEAESTGYRSVLSSVVGRMKAATTAALRKQGYDRQVWQAGFHDHICRNEADYRRIYRYIETNPANGSKIPISNERVGGRCRYWRETIASSGCHSSAGKSSVAPSGALK